MSNPYVFSDQLISEFEIKPIKRVHQSTFNSFFEDELYNTHEPMIIHGFDESDFGGCLSLWDSKFFNDVMGDKEVTIHSSDEPTLSFNPKNFSYKKLSFKEFIKHLENVSSTKKNGYMQSEANDSLTQQSYCYYRSISNKPNKKAASLDELPEEINQTFHLPEKLRFSDSSQFTTHSSILRIAQPGLEMWTHYDIPDNFLLQVKGQKRVFMFPPDQVFNLYITGSSSPIKSINIKPDIMKYPYISEALKNALWADINPGDVLFIPSCWPHCLSMKDLYYCIPEFEKIEHPLCVSVNIFFKNSERDPIYESKDVYGNKDYKHAQGSITKLENTLIPEIKKLPPTFAKFYLLKMSSILAREAEAISQDISDPSK